MIFSRVFIWSVSAVWSSLTALNRCLYSRGVFRQRKLSARVISVGNIQAGGAGKTPLVAWIARLAVARGMRVCILSRGYRGKWELDGGVIRPGAATTDPELCGDEPALLHSLVPEAWIGVGRDRIQQFERICRLASEELRPQLVILDDGFQHLKIARDLEVIALTSCRRTEIFHRDWAGAIQSQHLGIWTKGDSRPPQARVQVRLVLAPVPSSLPSIWLVSGTVGPAGVLASVTGAGYKVVRHLAFPDHARYSAKLVEGILANARAAGVRVALTGKDWVKWQRLGIKPEEVLVLEPTLELKEGGELCNRLLWGI